MAIYSGNNTYEDETKKSSFSATEKYNDEIDTTSGFLSEHDDFSSEPLESSIMKESTENISESDSDTIENKKGPSTDITTTQNELIATIEKISESSSNTYDKIHGDISQETTESTTDLDDKYENNLDSSSNIKESTDLANDSTINNYENNEKETSYSTTRIDNNEISSNFGSFSEANSFSSESLESSIIPGPTLNTNKSSSKKLIPESSITINDKTYSSETVTESNS